MDSTLFLSMFGLDPSQFEEAVIGPEETDAGWPMSIVQKPGSRKCPTCGKSDSVVIKDRSIRRLRHSMPNGIAEGLNNRIKTLKKISNGCLNFERFRKRALLIMTYSKKPEIGKKG